MEADDGDGEESPAPVRASPHFHPELLSLSLLHLLLCRDSNLIELSLEFTLLYIGVAKPPKGRPGRLFLPLCHKPTGAFREEEEGHRLNGRCGKEDSKWDAVGVLVLHEMRAIIDGCPNDGTYGELALIDGKSDTAEMGRSHFVDVDLRESEEPPDRYPY